jgi:hypothetical protein
MFQSDLEFSLVTVSAWTNTRSGSGVTQHIVFRPYMINGTIA